MGAGVLDGGTRAVRRPDLLLLAGGLLILLQTVVRAAIVLPSYYWQDDFVHLEAAGRLGLSREFLVRDYNGHLEMGSSFVYWLTGHVVGPSFAPAAWILLVLQVAASCLLLAVLRQLLGRSPWLLLPFAAYLFTPLGLPVATWWAAGLQALPLQIAMLTSLLCLVRALRLRSRRWAALSVAAFALGLVFWEKAALILPTLVLVLLLVEWAGQPFGRRVRRLVDAWPYLAPHVLVLVLYLALYLSVVDAAAEMELDRGTVDSGNPAQATGELVFRMLLPGLLGGPWTSAGAENTVLPAPPDVLAVGAALLVLGIVALSVWLRGARAAQAWVLVGCYVAVDLALVLVARGDFLYLVARDPRYITDALPVIAVGAAAAFSGPPVPRRSLPGLARAARSAPAAVAAGAVLVAGSLFSSALLAEELQHRPARDYVRDVLQAMDGDPGVSVISSRPPSYVSVYAYPDLEGLLRGLGEPRAFDRPGTEVRMFDGEAVLRPIVLLEPRLQASGPIEGCGWSLTAAPQPLGEVPGPGSGPEVLRLEYRTDAGATLHVAVGEDRQTVPLPAGAGQATFVVTGQEGAVEAHVTGSGAGSSCIDDVVVGTPWPVAP